MLLYSPQVTVAYNRSILRKEGPASVSNDKTLYIFKQAGQFIYMRFIKRTCIGLIKSIGINFAHLVCARQVDISYRDRKRFPILIIYFVNINLVHIIHFQVVFH